MTRAGVQIAPTAEVSDGAIIGPGSKIWHEAQVREGVVLGAQCIVGKGAYVDVGVRVGARCKLQNGSFIFHGFDLEDGVFLGPGAMLLNDHRPRAVNPDGTPKSADDWEVSRGRVCEGAALGAGAIVLPGLTVGRWALAGAGAVVTRDVPDHGLVVGNPARLVGFACLCGRRLQRAGQDGDETILHCSHCAFEIRVQTRIFAQAR